MKKLNYILTLQIVCTVTWGAQNVYAKKNLKQDEDKEESLYRNVLPYIKEITLSAGLTKQELKMPFKHKDKLNHVKNIQLLTELDKKVLPWLNEVTLKVNKIAETKTDKIKFRKKNQNRIMGPSALNSDQTFLVDTKKHVKKKNETKKLNDNLNNIESFHQENSEPPPLQDLETPHLDDTHLKDFDETQLQDTNTKSEYNQNILLEDNQNKISLDVASEVAKLTNQIAEFQQEVVTEKNTKKFKVKKHPEKIHAETQKTSEFNESSSKTKLNEIQKKKTKKVTLKEKNLADKINTKKTSKKQLKTVKLIVGGSIGLDGIIRYKVEEEICTFNESFNEIKKFFDPADHVIINLESSIGSSENNMDDNNASITDQEAVQALLYAGIETVVLANAYILENGLNAVTTTNDILTKNNLLVSGLTENNKQQEPVVFANNGITIGILSYCISNDGCLKNENETGIKPAAFNEELIKNEVTELRESGIDIIVVYLHWENEESLMKVAEVKELVQNLSSIKIDALVGCHPLIQNHYFYENMLVFFNLGNLLTPMHVHFSKIESHAGISEKQVNKLFGKRNEHWETPILSKLLQIEVNRYGLVHNQLKYLPIRVGLNQNHCLQVEKIPGNNWITICSEDDKLCKS
nr:uncharacterized protein LOC105850417 [Hydra vulgaris]